MNFDWNLSSSDDEEEENNRMEWENRRVGFSHTDSAAESDKPIKKAVAIVTPTTLNEVMDKESEDSEDESIEWEDASPVEAVNDSPCGGASLDNIHRKLRPVTIDLRKPPPETSSSKEKVKRVRSRKRYRHDTLPDDMRVLLRHLHNSSLLTELCRAQQCLQASTNEIVVAAALSLIPSDVIEELAFHANPSRKDLERLCSWYIGLVHEVRARHQTQRAQARAQGAPTYRGRRRSRNRAAASTASPTAEESSSRRSRLPLSVETMLQFTAYVSTSEVYEESRVWRGDLFGPEFITALFVSTCSALGWRVRWTQALNTIPCDLDVSHPLLSSNQHVFTTMCQKLGDESSIPIDFSSKGNKKRKLATEEEDAKPSASVTLKRHGEKVARNSLEWIEVLICTQQGGRLQWTHTDPARRLVDRPDKVEKLWAKVSSSLRDNKKSKVPIPYALAVEGKDENSPRFTDVTRRYALSWIESLRARGLIRGKETMTKDRIKQTWWNRTLNQLNYLNDGADNADLKSKSAGTTLNEAIILDDSENAEDKKMSVEEMEEHNLQTAAESEALPTSKAAFKSHPIYVIESVLNSTEVLAPDAKKRICGVFKGQFVYRRSDISTAFPARRWLYRGRQVKEGEKPVKRVKARKRASKSFQVLKTYGVGEGNDGSEGRRQQDLVDGSAPLDDDMQDLFAIWQTQKWSPMPVGPNDPIPVNEYKNIELELLNPGLVHVDQRGAAAVAKTLGIPYAPCLLGFEGHGGNRTPTIRGIVVHEHNATLVEEAYSEYATHQDTVASEKHERRILFLWRKLFVGILTRERIEREYGEGNHE